MNELFTDFKKQFEKLSISADVSKQGAAPAQKTDNYSVSIMYDQYYVRKREIVEGVLMVAICDVEKDGLTPEQVKRAEKDGLSVVDEIVQNRSTFNIGQVDMMFEDFEKNFKNIEELVAEVSQKVNVSM